MKHKNHNGHAVAPGIDSVLTEALPRHIPTSAGPTPRSVASGVGGLTHRAGPLATGAGMAEPKSLGRPTREQIEQRAYELYIARQGREGTPLEDWLRAESELTAPPTQS